MGFKDLLSNIRLSWGVHPEGHKDLTSECGISDMPMSERLVLPLARQLGQLSLELFELLSQLSHRLLVSGGLSLLELLLGGGDLLLKLLNRILLLLAEGLEQLLEQLGVARSSIEGIGRQAGEVGNAAGSCTRTGNSGKTEGTYGSAVETA